MTKNRFKPQKKTALARNSKAQAKPTVKRGREMIAAMHQRLPNLIQSVERAIFKVPASL
jgi:hypothetical protein